MNLDKIEKRQSAADFGPYLPGMDDCAFAAPSPSSPALRDQGDWWVATSAKQLLDTAGLPAGFQHRLMHDSKTILTGTGPDARRTFEAQAVFLNRAERAARVSHTLFQHPDLTPGCPNNLRLAVTLR